jgi:hypothetical protein
MWGAKVEGLRATLGAQEQHSEALEQELGMRPTVLQVGGAEGFAVAALLLVLAVRYSAVTCSALD